MQVWDMRAKRSVQTLQEKYQIASVAFADGGDQVGASSSTAPPPPPSPPQAACVTVLNARPDIEFGWWWVGSHGSRQGMGLCSAIATSSNSNCLVPAGRPRLYDAVGTHGSCLHHALAGQVPSHTQD